MICLCLVYHDSGCISRRQEERAPLQCVKDCIRPFSTLQHVGEYSSTAPRQVRAPRVVVGVSNLEEALWPIDIILALCSVTN